MDSNHGPQPYQRANFRFVYRAAGVENNGKTCEMQGFPASNDSVIIHHFQSKSTGKTHIFGK